jgi:hypothetical protein
MSLVLQLKEFRDSYDNNFTSAFSYKERKYYKNSVVKRK